MISKYHWPDFSKIGIGLLQSGIPATTSLLTHSLKGNASKAKALSFGRAIIIGSAAYFPHNSFFYKLLQLFLLQSSSFSFALFGRKEFRTDQSEPRGIGVILAVKQP